MYVEDMTKSEAEEWLRYADREGLTENDKEDLRDHIASR